MEPEFAVACARVALANLDREYPNKLDHVLNDAGDAATPRSLHPVFYGSFDWHSSVHMHWTLVRLLRLHRPALGDLAPIVSERLGESFAPDRLAGETAYLERPLSRSFERTYGWAWLLELAAEVTRAARDGVDAAGEWAEALAPLRDAFEERYLEFLPRAAYPVRTGTHPNSAFGFLLAREHAVVHDATALEAAIRDKALVWFGDDRDASAAYEPSGEDFLSPTLVEAALMARVLDRAAFVPWLDRFLPDWSEAALGVLLNPVRSDDPSDPKHSHLDGLNLSRAWNWDAIASALDAADPRTAVARRAAERHRETGLPTATGGSYMGEHWLASFAVLALTAGPP